MPLGGLHLIVKACYVERSRVCGRAEQLDRARAEKLPAARRRVVSNWKTYLLGDRLEVALGLLLRLLLSAISSLALDGLVCELRRLPHLVVVVCLVPERRQAARVGCLVNILI